MQAHHTPKMIPFVRHGLTTGPSYAIFNSGHTVDFELPILSAGEYFLFGFFPQYYYSIPGDVINSDRFLIAALYS